MLLQGFHSEGADNSSTAEDTQRHATDPIQNNRGWCETGTTLATFEAELSDVGIFDVLKMLVDPGVLNQGR